MADVTIPGAFIAGLLSFLSPCVLPLVPGYLSYMSGVSIAAEDERRPFLTAAVACAFVLGFSAVFVAFGTTATVLGSFLLDNKESLARVSGVLIILMGLVFLGVLKIPLLYREARFHPRPKAGFWGSALLGGAFAFGWTPCIGLTLGAVLLMAAGRSAEGGAGEGALLLAVYSLGLGVPFILAGLGVSQLTRVLGWFRKHMRTVNIVSGLFLIGMGLLFVTNRVFELSAWMQRTFPQLENFWTG